MQSPLDQFAKEVRQRRRERDLSQRDIADKLQMSIRTIINLEKNRSNPKMETVLIIAKELGISLDALIFEQPISSAPKCVGDFFNGKSESESQRYINLCVQASQLFQDQSK